MVVCYSTLLSKLSKSPALKGSRTSFYAALASWGEGSPFPATSCPAADSARVNFLFVNQVTWWIILFSIINLDASVYFLICVSLDFFLNLVKDKLKCLEGAHSFFIILKIMKKVVPLLFAILDIVFADWPWIFLIVSLKCPVPVFQCLNFYTHFSVILVVTVSASSFTLRVSGTASLTLPSFPWALRGHFPCVLLFALVI